MVNLIFNIKKIKCNNLVLKKKKLGVWSLSRFGTLIGSFSQPVGLYKNKLIKICSIWCILINIKYLKIRKSNIFIICTLVLHLYTIWIFCQMGCSKYNLFGGFDRSYTISWLSYTAWIMFAWLLYFFSMHFSSILQIRLVFFAYARFNPSPKIY